MTATLTPTPAQPDPATDPDPTAGPVDDAERARRIRSVVRARSREVRERHPVLRHQDAIGASILAVSAVGVVAVAVAYAAGALAWWATVPLAAIFMSLAHEIEHDQIHRLYFRRNKRAQDVMFAVCWLLRPGTISPWARKPLHLLHHDASGTEADIEEQAITNGQRWSAKRALMMLDPLASAVLRLPTDPEHRSIYVRYVARAFFPLTYLSLALWYVFLVLGLARLLVGAPVLAIGPVAAAAEVITFLVVVWIGPNVLRSTAINFISSNMHYFGDVEKGNVIQQTQVLDRWYLIPAQLFCCNFGSTHGIHHFVPNDPFYVRQLTVGAAHEVMRDNGVRFNDLGTFTRANRFGRS